MDISRSLPRRKYRTVLFCDKQKYRELILFSWIYVIRLDPASTCVRAPRLYVLPYGNKKNPIIKSALGGSSSLGSKPPPEIGVLFHGA